MEKDYLEGKNQAAMIHTLLSELVLIDMGLDWSQIDILAPVICYVEQLHLVRNQCSQICTKYVVPKDHFKILRFINLEENGIESWDEVDGFRTLPNLQRLTLNKNKIKNITYKQGWKQVYMISIEDNLIDNWESFDQIGEFPMVKNLRVTGNPIMDKE